MIVIAVSSGTSADGLDVGVVELRWADDVIELSMLETYGEPWPGRLRDDVLALLPPAVTTAAELSRLDATIGQAVGAAARRAMAGAGRDATLVVSPGQTVHHEVQDGRCLGTLQLGQPAWVVESTGLPVVSDLRARDVAAGGHGAPLASTLDALWLADDTTRRAALNLGGIANVTVLGRSDEVLAWDTGPANCLIDVATARVTGGAERYDRDGLRAARGAVHTELLKRLLHHPYFRLSPPVSTGRELFSSALLEASLDAVAPVEDDDLVATLTELTAQTVADALRPHGVTEVVASGGGTRNPTLLAALRRALAPTRLSTSDEWGLPAQAKEVALWALLGFLTWHGCPSSTTVTGAGTPRVLGRISPGDAPLTLPASAQPPRRLRVVPMSLPTEGDGR